MGANDLPKEFDLVILGTGLAESILSAAVSRNGHTVLHLDARDFYGGKWSSVNLDCLERGDLTAAATIPNQEESSLQFGWRDLIRNVDHVWYAQDADTKDALKKLSRKFNLDVFPKVIMAKEEMIELLIESDVARYLEFKCVNKLLVSLPPDGKVLEPIPLSRSDIFVNKSLSLIEKRKLAKFIELVLKNTPQERTEKDQTAEVDSGAQDMSSRTFESLAEAAHLSPKLQHLMRGCISSLEDALSGDRSNEEFERKCLVFLQSIGRYGNQTPYLWTLYGVGEICQAFCRMSAIYGGIFILKKTIQQAKVVEQQLEITLDDDVIKTKHLILGPEAISATSIDRKPAKTVCRGILVTAGNSLLYQSGQNDEEGSLDDNHIWFYKIGDAEVLELNHSSHAVPKPYYLIQVTCPAREDEEPRKTVENLMSQYVNFKFDNQAEKQTGEDNLDAPEDSRKFPTVLFGCYFLLDFYESSQMEQHSDCVHQCSSSSTTITSEVLKAKEIFMRLFPGEDFLPKPVPPKEAEGENDL